MRKIYIVLLLTALLLNGCSGGEGAGGNAVLGSEGGDSGFDASSEYSDIAGVSHETDVSEANEGDVIVIREKMFVAQTDDVYINGDDYLGKTIQWEGIFNILEDPLTGETLYYVYRYGPGCCGYDDNAGFEVIWEDGEYPDGEEWVEATGVLESYEYDGWKYLRVRLSSMNVMDEWGEAYVNQ